MHRNRYTRANFLHIRIWQGEEQVGIITKFAELVLSDRLQVAGIKVLWVQVPSHKGKKE